MDQYPFCTDSDFVRYREQTQQGATDSPLALSRHHPPSPASTPPPQHAHFDRVPDANPAHSPSLDFDVQTPANFQPTTLSTAKQTTASRRNYGAFFKEMPHSEEQWEEKRKRLDLMDVSGIIRLFDDVISPDCQTKPDDQLRGPLNISDYITRRPSEAIIIGGNPQRAKCLSTFDTLVFIGECCVAFQLGMEPTLVYKAMEDHLVVSGLSNGRLKSKTLQMYQRVPAWITHQADLLYTEFRHRASEIFLHAAKTPSAWDKLSRSMPDDQFKDTLIRTITPVSKTELQTELQADLPVYLPFVIWARILRQTGIDCYEELHPALAMRPRTDALGKDYSISFSRTDFGCWLGFYLRNTTKASPTWFTTANESMKDNSGLDMTDAGTAHFGELWSCKSNDEGVRLGGGTPPFPHSLSGTMTWTDYTSHDFPNNAGQGFIFNPYSLSPPRALLVPEVLLHQVKVYFENSCQNMYFDDQGNLLLTRNGPKLNNALCNDFDSYCFTATMLMGKGLSVEFRRALSKAFALVEKILQAEHPRTLACFLEVFIHLTQTGFAEVTSLLCDYIKKMSAKSIRHGHSWGHICWLLGELDSESLDQAMAQIWKCTTDIFDRNLGACNRLAVSARLDYIKRVVTNHLDEELLLRNLLAQFGDIPILPTPRVMLNLAHNLNKQGRHSEAECMATDILSLLRGNEMYGSRIAEMIECLKIVSRSQFHQGKTPAAELNMRHAIQMIVDQWGKQHPWVPEFKNVLEGWLQFWGRQADADIVRGEIKDLMGKDESDE